MVETDDATGDVAARGIVVGADERPYAGICPKDAGGREDGRHLGSFSNQQCHFLGRHGDVVAFFEGNAGGGRTDDADRVAGDKDVGIGRLTTAVDDVVVYPVREDQQGSLGRIHPHVYARQLRYMMTPDSAGVDDDRGVEIFRHACGQVAGMDARDGIAFPDESRDFGMEPDLAAVEFGIQHIGCAQTEGVYAAVRHADGPDQVGIHGRFDPAGHIGIDDFGTDAGSLAGFHESLLVGQVIFRQGDEKAVRLVDAVGGYPPQDLVFLDAFFRGFGIVYGVAGARVQQAVVAAGGAGGDVGPFDEQGS